MNDAQLIARIAQTDPYASDTPLPESWSSAVVFTEIERRMDMKTQERLTAPDTPTRPDARPLPRRGWAVAGAVFAMVLLGGITAVWLSGGDSTPEPPVATTIAPEVTTTAGVTTTAAVTDTTEVVTETTVDTNEALLIDAETLMEAFVAGFNSYDADRWLTLWAEPTFTTALHDTEAINDEADLRARIEWASIVNETWRFESCQIWGTRASCRVSMTDAFTETVALDGAYLIWGFEPRGEQIAEVRLQMTGLAAYGAATTAFQVWVDENHPEAGTLIHIPTGGMAWRYGDDAGAALLDLLPEYATAQGG